jgi:hypothetical protein
MLCTFAAAGSEQEAPSRTPTFSIRRSLLQSARVVDRALCGAIWVLKILEDLDPRFQCFSRLAKVQQACRNNFCWDVRSGK